MLTGGGTVWAREDTARGKGSSLTYVLPLAAYRNQMARTDPSPESSLTLEDTFSTLNSLKGTGNRC